jgi:hypothetical protein
MKRDKRDYDEVPVDIAEIRLPFPCSENPVSSGLMSYFHQGFSEFVLMKEEVRVYIN